MKNSLIVFTLCSLLLILQLPAQNFSQLSSIKIEELQNNSNSSLDLSSGDHWTDQVGWGLKAIEANNTWEISTGSRDVIVAIIDTGVDNNHPDLSNNIWINPAEIANNGIDDDENGFIDDISGWDFVNDDNDPYDDHVHGTHMAGIIGAELNNYGLVGVAPTITIMPIKAVDASGIEYEDLVAKGIDYAVSNGAHVLSISLGFRSQGSILQQSIENAWNEGLVIVAAAGNEGLEMEYYPAAHPDVIAVGSFDVYFQIGIESNYGDHLEILAPGVNINSTIPTSFDTPFLAWTGTSMATAFVSGTVALMLSVNTNLTNTEVREILHTTTKEDNIDFDIKSGYGMLDTYGAVLAANNTESKNENTLVYVIIVGGGVSTIVMIGIILRKKLKSNTNL